MNDCKDSATTMHTDADTKIMISDLQIHVHPDSEIKQNKENQIKEDTEVHLVKQQQNGKYWCQMCPLSYDCYILTNSLFLGLVIMHTCYGIGQNVAMPYSPALFVQSGYTMDEAAWIYALSGITDSVARPLFGFAFDIQAVKNHRAHVMNFFVALGEYVNIHVSCGKSLIYIHYKKQIHVAVSLPSLNVNPLSIAILINAYIN